MYLQRLIIFDIIMRRPGTNVILPFVFSIAFIVPELIYAETCNRFHRKENVAVDLQLCSFENYTEPVHKGSCMESCFNKPWVGKTKLFQEFQPVHLI